MSPGLPSYPAPRPLEHTPHAAAGQRLIARVPEALASVLAGGLLLAAYRQPWWSFRLYAPQYPSGLGVDILLSGSRGDVHELDTLNHYIGMASLSTAAPVERQLSLAVVAATALLVTTLLLVPRRRANRLALAAALAIPLGFVADFFYWLYRFGHHLNPHAPLKLRPFTPTLFGNGVIGQFMTFARPELGFWLATGAAGVAVLLIALRERAAIRR
jgi:copper chaperone NosL